MLGAQKNIGLPDAFASGEPGTCDVTNDGQNPWYLCIPKAGRPRSPSTFLEGNRSGAEAAAAQRTVDEFSLQRVLGGCLQSSGPLKDLPNASPIAQA